MQGARTAASARDLIAGIEAAYMIRKGQVLGIPQHNRRGQAWIFGALVAKAVITNSTPSAVRFTRTLLIVGANRSTRIKAAAPSAGVTSTPAAFNEMFSCTAAATVPVWRPLAPAANTARLSPAGMMKGMLRPPAADSGSARVEPILG